MYVLVLQISFTIDDAYSLKDKRKIIKSIIQKGQNRFKVSSAEIGFHDILNRSEIAFALVTSQSRVGRQHLEELFRFIETNYPIVVTEFDIIEY